MNKNKICKSLQKLYNLFAMLISSSRILYRNVIFGSRANNQWQTTRNIGIPRLLLDFMEFAIRYPWIYPWI